LSVPPVVTAVPPPAPFVGASEGELAAEWRACLRHDVGLVDARCADGIEVAVPGESVQCAQIACAGVVRDHATRCNGALAAALDALAWARATADLGHAACATSTAPVACAGFAKYVSEAKLPNFGAARSYGTCGTSVVDTARRADRVLEAQKLVAAHRCRTDDAADACTELAAYVGAEPNGRAVAWRATIEARYPVLERRAAERLKRLQCAHFTFANRACDARIHALTAYVAQFAHGDAEQASTRAELTRLRVERDRAEAQRPPPPTLSP
jgi:hypothetical protein